jgi:hypothetical protein
MEVIQSLSSTIKEPYSFYLDHSMTFTYQASTHGNCDREMQVRQRLAPFYAQDTPPLTLVYCWMIAQLYLLIGTNMDLCVPIIWAMIIGWCSCLVGGAAVSLCRIFRSQWTSRFIREVYSFMDSCRYDTQIGEIPTKEDRRLQYLKHENARRIARTKNNRGGRKKGKENKRKRKEILPLQ